MPGGSNTPEFASVVVWHGFCYVRRLDNRQSRRSIFARLENLMAAGIRIGLLTAQEGPAGLWAPSALACANLAVTEINMSCGLLGCQLELCSVNTGVTVKNAADAAQFALHIEEVDAIIGMVPSYAREPMARVIEERVPFIYTPQFEGPDYRDQSIVTTGETSRELLLPAIDWLVQQKKGHRYFLCGSDYVWPRATFAAAREIIRDAGGIVTGETYLPLGCEDFGELLSHIRSTRTQVVMPYFLGYDAVHFNRAFGDMGLASEVLRFSSAIDETILYALDENATENLFVSSAYFSSVKSRNNGGFLERYHSFYGDTPPPPNGFGQSCYEGVYCLAALAEAAGTMRSTEVRRALGQTLQRRTARGTNDVPVAGGRQPIHFARVDGFDFTVLSTTQGARTVHPAKNN